MAQFLSQSRYVVNAKELSRIKDSKRAIEEGRRMNAPKHTEKLSTASYYQNLQMFLRTHTQEPDCLRLTCSLARRLEQVTSPHCASVATSAK